MPSRNVSASTTIDAPPAAVFAILADPRQHQRIDGSGTVQGTVSGPERLTLGAEFGMDMKLGASYKIKNTVVEFEEDRLIAWRHVGAHRWRYELTPTPGGGTEVTETWDLSRYPLPLRLVISTLFAAKTRKAVPESLAKLKQAAEADASVTG
jgi:uncharacterized protein YndB with AHSA1/START domain